MAPELAVIDRLSDLHLDLEKVNGTLATILDVGSATSLMQSSPKDLLSMLQLLQDVVSPACEELEEIMKALNVQTVRPVPLQKQTSRSKQKGR